MKRSIIRTLSKSAIALCSGLFALTAMASPEAEIAITDAKVQSVMSVQNEVTADLMRQPEVLGTAIGLNAAGVPALKVYVDRDSTRVGEVMRSIPKQYGNVGVDIELTDKFRAVIGDSIDAAHTQKQTPPIQLGTSGGWTYDLANGFCCGGTLGALVSIGGVQHILSCYHVFEGDIVPGGNGRVATTGDPVIQPGLIDVGCNAGGAQSVGTLVVKHSLPSSNVDCAVAQVIPGMVRTDGAILEIGTISSQTVAAALRQKVKKSGRTTGLTSSQVNGLNGTVSVTYENECAGGAAFTKTFTGQIFIKSPNNSFIAAGDSGSLMVENKARRPRAIGLLYASSTTTAIANPIDQVLSFLGATMVGQ